MSTPRVAVFIDGAYMYKVQRRALDWWIDPKELLLEIEEQYGKIVQAIYFVENTKDPRRNSFIRALSHIGFSVHTKDPVTHINRETGKTYQMVNFDLDICCEIFEKLPQYDHLVLVTGANDFEGVLRRISSHNKKFTIIGSNKMIGPQLLNYAGGQFVNFNDWKEQIIKEESEEEKFVAR